jgi:MFS family permease
MNGIIVVISQYPVARWVDRLPRATGLILGSLMYGIGYLSMGWVGSFSLTLPVIVAVTAGEVVFTPLTLSVVADIAPEEKRGRYMGFFGLSQTLGVSFGPLLGGVLLDAFPTDPRFIWGLIALVAFIAAAGFQWWGIARRKETGPSPS